MSSQIQQSGRPTAAGSVMSAMSACSFKMCVSLSLPLLSRGSRLHTGGDMCPSKSTAFICADGSCPDLKKTKLSLLVDGYLPHQGDMYRDFSIWYQSDSEL